ncbi:acetyl-CoA carboxylase biotin carboxyl carrier protein [Paracoccus saliphilus]|nr:acetyl-CoA carboxylase biotin carboxyl carrier protein subunit [Paracoccus saliphilus]WCR01573.1 acetyl-CoA carboxylase biotin carboxyl carrier protein subunit [Paracoccus saliphilus]
MTILRENASGQAGTQIQTEPPVASTVEFTEENAGAGSITAPLSGICYLAPDSGTSPFISIGARIAEGETLCVIEAMKVMTPVTASAEGIVEAILVEDGASVTTGDPLVRIR